MNKYLITGVNGFVAYHFINYLNSLNTHYDILGIDIEIPENLNNYKWENVNIQYQKINLLDYPVLESAITSFLPTHIIHLASFSSVAKSWNMPIESFINNTNIFLNIAEIIRKNNIKCRLLSVGSSEEYGNVSPDCIPINESVPLNPVSPYAVARVSQEMLSKCYVSSFGLDIILTRSFNHIGPKQKDIFVVSSFIKQIIDMKYKNNLKSISLSTGDISIIRDFLDVRDVVKAYYLLLENGISGELYNVCSGKGHSIKEIINMLAEIFDVEINVIIDADKIRPGDNKVIIGDNSKIIKETGWKPVIQLNESLNDIIFYWKGELGIIESSV